jgi:hypothetical protein
MIRGAWVLACAGIALSVWAADWVWQPLMAAPAVNALANFAHRVSTNDVTIYWNCTRPKSDGIRLGGVVQNSKGVPVKFMELELVAADGRDRYGPSAKTALRDIVLHTNQVSPFTLQLRSEGKGVRFDLFYKYYVGAAVATQQVNFMARDACSPSQHRIPKPSQ